MLDIEDVLPRVQFTPAERGVLVEQAKTMRVMLNQFIHHGEAGTGEDVCRQYMDMQRHIEYIGQLITTKMNHTAADIEKRAS